MSIMPSIHSFIQQNFPSYSLTTTSSDDVCSFDCCCCYWQNATVDTFHRFLCHFSSLVKTGFQSNRPIDDPTYSARRFLQIQNKEPFRVPVDWKGLGLHDYPQLIKNPMVRNGTIYDMPSSSSSSLVASLPCVGGHAFLCCLLLLLSSSSLIIQY